MSCNQLPVNVPFNIEINLADSNSINGIVQICQAVFTHDMFSQIPSIQKSWYLHVINSSIGEIYVAYQNRVLVGFIIITIDLINYEKEQAKFKPPFWLRLMTILLHPNVFIYVLINKWYMLKKFIFGHKQEFGEKYSESGDKEMELVRLAIAPEYQNNGIGKYMFSFIEKRTIALNRDIIRLTALKKNKRAISLYESCGCLKTKKNDGNCQFIELKKSLLSNR